MSEKKSVLVTGASSGVGDASCRTLAALGWSVIGIDRDAAGLSRLHSEGVIAEAVVLDLANPADVGQALEGLDVAAIANVAGVGPDVGSAELIWAVNLVAPLAIIEALGVRMPAGGAVVNVASITGELAPDPDPALSVLLADPCAPTFLADAAGTVSDPTLAYTYSKWALLAHSRRLAVELAPRIRVNCVSPGVLDTPMGTRSMQFDWTQKAVDRIPSGRLGLPAEVAAAVVFLLGDDASYVTGSSLVVDGGYVAAKRPAPARVDPAPRRQVPPSHDGGQRAL